MSIILKFINFILRNFGFKISKFDFDRKKHKAAKKIFVNRKLLNSKKGYWYLDPMPSEEHLSQYYENAYWFNRGGKEMHVNSRDLIHWSILNKFINLSVSTKINFLNFGAGHGGISHVFWNAKHSVHNVEPSFIPQFYDERWVNYKKINDVKENSIDLIYGSHSLEHVQNIDLFLLEVKRVLKDDGYVFWEVPNGAHSTNGPPINKIFIPHTYYFRKEFFNEVFSRSIYNETLNSPKYFDSAIDWENCESEDGNVIRFLGQI